MNVGKCTLIEALTCKESDSVVTVAKALREHTLRHVFVVNTENYPVGIVSVTDINNRVVAEGKNPSEMTAKEIMTPSIDVYDTEKECKDVFCEMLKKERVIAPVVKRQRIIGMITIHEVMKHKGDTHE